MGEYTGVRVKCVVKEEYRAAIHLLHRAVNALKSFDTGRWKAVHSSFHSFPGLEVFAQLRRADHIPFGPLACMPDDFSDDDANPEGYTKYDEASGKWEFCCSLKNYEGEVEAFAQHVLFAIAESVEECCSLLEGDFDYDEDRWFQHVVHYAKSKEVQDGR